jgi:hypothetical protein
MYKKALCVTTYTQEVAELYGRTLQGIDRTQKVPRSCVELHHS